MATSRGSNKVRFLAYKSGGKWHGGWELKNTQSWCYHHFHESKNKALLCAATSFIEVRDARNWKSTEQSSKTTDSRNN